MSDKINDIFGTSSKYHKFTSKDLQHFVIRARIVQEHSLATDLGQLRRLAKYKFNVKFQIDERTGEQSGLFEPVELLPTEQVESAAARVRPVFLYSDGIYYADVLAYLYEQADDESIRIKTLKLLELYHVADPDYPHSSKGKTYQPGAGVSNKEMAGAWLYGALLHEDQRRRSFSESFYLEEVYFNATKTVASMMLAVVQTLHLIEELVIQKKLDLPTDLWTHTVTVSAGTWTRPGKAKMYIAEVGTRWPLDFAKPIDGHSGWKEFDVRELYGE